MGGLLRLRTSPEFKVVRSYGHLFPDDQYDNLYHIISCDPHDSFAFDFEFTSSDGFEVHGGGPPFVQMVFQYTVLVPAADAASEGDAPAQTGTTIKPVRYAVSWPQKELMWA